MYVMTRTAVIASATTGNVSTLGDGAAQQAMRSSHA